MIKRMSVLVLMVLLALVFFPLISGMQDRGGNREARHGLPGTGG